jgi:hypothetical protein
MANTQDRTKLGYSFFFLGWTDSEPVGAMLGRRAGYPTAAGAEQQQQQQQQGGRKQGRRGKTTSRGEKGFIEGW